MVAHPEVQLISFTGETTTGAEIIKNGADTMKRFSMELGGKSPAVIFEDADLEKAWILWFGEFIHLMGSAAQPIRDYLSMNR